MEWKVAGHGEETPGQGPKWVMIYLCARILDLANVNVTFTFPADLRERISSTRFHKAVFRAAQPR
ncbi:hypothetical protein OG589_40325 [Sphaerisporangium sp. NBC_01403]|uniref:hypothetical protein n=1 Tax=Sphaerisporangium sp. NBC_01403 TaxID=2903599 RepID=UPI00324D9D8E